MGLSAGGGGGGLYVVSILRHREQQLVKREKLLAITHPSKVIEKTCLGFVKV